jgi:hypothetical protein
MENDIHRRITLFLTLLVAGSLFVFPSPAAAASLPLW